MQASQAPIFELTLAERMLITGYNKKLPKDRKVKSTTQTVITGLYAAAKFVAPQPERPREYDHSITVPAFNDWVDRQIEKQLAAQRALREAAKAAAEAETTVEGSANGEVLR